MKDELKERSSRWNNIEDAQADINDWMDYYNNDRYQMGLQKMSPNEFYTYISEGIYPVSMPKTEKR